MAGANAPTALAARPIRIVICDEVDRFPRSAGTEGDPVGLAFRRTTTFWNRKKILASTPTLKGLSRIETAYEESDKRRYHVPCPECLKTQVLSWERVKWPEGRPEEAVYRCIHCEVDIQEGQKHRMLANGKWIAEKPFKGIAGFWISALYSPWATWRELAVEFVDIAHSRDKERLKQFTNTVLAETWEDYADTVDENAIYARREPYIVPGGEITIPLMASILTAAVDVQHDRLECEIKAWGAGRESWGIEYRVFYGPPAEENVWKDLDVFLHKEYRHESGVILRPACTFIDSGDGNLTHRVYEFVRSREARQIYACKGSSTPGAPLLSRPSTSNIGRVKLYHVGTHTAKDLVYGRLKIAEPGAGYSHFPLSYPKEFFEMLTSERAVIRYTKGKPKREWTLPAGRRNEALDINVYHEAALEFLNPDWDLIRPDAPPPTTFRQVFKYSGETVSIEVMPKAPLILCCDFNLSPCVWEVVQDDRAKIAVVDEIVINHAGPGEMVKEFKRRYGGHGGITLVYGPATGLTAQHAGRSNYAVMLDMGLSNQRIKRTDPAPEDRIASVNALLEANKLSISPRCVLLKKDLTQSVWDTTMPNIDRASGRGFAVDALSWYISNVYPLKQTKPNLERRFWK